MVLAIVSSPVSTLVFNPVLAEPSSTTFSTLPTISTIPSAPTTIGQAGKEGEFTTQAALSLTRSTQTSNVVDSKAYYDISFRTSTSGVIKFIRMSFPEGTYVGAALLIEATGIGPGTISAGAGGNTLAYTVTNAVNVPANTNIRIQIANANNPSNPGESLTVSITTRDSTNAIIDGPTSTNAYNIKQIGTGQIADGAITSSKPAESFMKRVTLTDTPAGNAQGWNPNGASRIFEISEPAISSDIDNSFFTVEVLDQEPAFLVPSLCDVIEHNAEDKEFFILCSMEEAAPQEGSELHYVVGNLPQHFICGPDICRQ
jgi:hypothetical protein